MKTNKFFLSFSLLLSALLLGSCSENTLPSGTDDPTPEPGVVTRFCSGTDPNAVPPLNGPKKTSMDAEGSFYWTLGDRIWVKTGSNTYTQDDHSNINATQPSADFWIPGNLTEQSYPVYYTGQNDLSNSSLLKVRIAKRQVQRVSNNSEHFAVSGDCGIATAEKNTNNNAYSFTLNHKASYLILVPFADQEESGSIYLDSVTVTSNNTLCGTYTFDDNGINTGSVANDDSKSTSIRLVTGEDGYGFPVGLAQNQVKCGGYMVIQPGTHALTFTYHVRYMGVKMTSSHTVTSREFAVNKYYRVAHKLNVERNEFMFDFPDTYYMWDAKRWYWYGQNMSYPIVPSEGDPRYFNETLLLSTSSVPLERDGQYSCKGYKDDGTGFTPNVNDLTWYCVYGDPHLDNTTVWTLGGHEYTGGLWLKKKDVIKAENPGVTGMFVRYQATKADKSGTDGDYRTKSFYDGPKYPVTSGKPNDTSKYFFLPFLGTYTEANLIHPGIAGFYWSSSPLPPDYTEGYGYHSRNAYFLYFVGKLSVLQIKCYATNGISWGNTTAYTYPYESWGMVAGHRPDGSNWFQ